MRRPTSTATFGARALTHFTSVLARVTVTLATVALVACGAQPVGAPAPIAGDAPRSDNTISALQPSPGVGAGGSDDFASTTLVEIATLDQPVDAASRTNDAAVYFVSRTGTIHRFVDGTFAPDAVLDISDLTEGDGERGLLGLAFSPDGATAYINYTNTSGDTTIASLVVDVDGAFDRESLRTLLTIEQPYRNHNAGDIVVEPSGTLLVPMGDGGSADDPLRVSLDSSSPLGKVLRVDPRDGSVTMVAKGLRNPWRVDLFDDRLWLADVGQNQWEEVSVLDGVSQRRGVPLSSSSAASSSDSKSSRATAPPTTSVGTRGGAFCLPAPQTADTTSGCSWRVIFFGPMVGMCNPNSISIASAFCKSFRTSPLTSSVYRLATMAD